MGEYKGRKSIRISLAGETAENENTQSTKLPFSSVATSPIFCVSAHGLWCLTVTGENRGFVKMSKSHCKKTGKVKFRTHEQALVRAGKILTETKVTRTGMMRGYMCPFCNRWHLTSQNSVLSGRAAV